MLKKFSAFLLYRVLGWELIGDIPRQQAKVLLVFLPHTSNWDFVIAWLFIRAENLEVTIFGKDAFNFFPLKYFYPLLGVVPIQRGQRSSFVTKATDLYNRHDRLWTAMAPEGTRKYMTELKSGYYYLAKAAGIPVVMVGPNFSEKAIRLLPPRSVLSSFEQDAQALVDFSKNMYAKHPARSFSP